MNVNELLYFLYKRNHRKKSNYEVEIAKNHKYQKYRKSGKILHDNVFTCIEGSKYFE